MLLRFPDKTELSRHKGPSWVRYPSCGALLADIISFTHFRMREGFLMIQGGYGMDREHDAQASGQNDELRYADRGPDNIEDLTRSDENAMDRAAQAGTTGAFGMGAGTDSEQRREDAAAAFGGAVEADNEQPSDTSSTASAPLSGTPGEGVALDGVPYSSVAAGQGVNDDLAGAPQTGGAGGTSSMGVRGGTRDTTT
jgi:hypothetical protein